MKRNELETYYRQIYQSLFLYALSLTHNKEEAEDLVGDAFMKACLSFEEGSFKAWIYRVVLNEYINLKKKKNRIEPDSEETLISISSSEDILGDIIKKEEKRQLYEAIYRLKDAQRDVILLSIDKELDDKEISSILHMSVDHVRVTRHRAKQSLLKIMNGGKSNG